MTINRVSISHGWDWLAHAWRLFMREPGLAIGLFLTIAGIQLLVSLMPVIGQIVGTLVAPVFGGGYLYFARRLDRNEEVEFGDLFHAFRQPGKLGPMLTLGAINMALAIVAVIPLLVAVAGYMELVSGSDPDISMIGVVTSTMTAMIIALVVISIVIMLMYFAVPLVMLADVDAGKALKISFFSCLRNFLPLTLYSIVVLVLAMVAAIPLGLGLIVVIPVLMLSQYAAYKDIFEGVQV